MHRHLGWAASVVLAIGLAGCADAEGELPGGADGSSSTAATSPTATGSSSDASDPGDTPGGTLPDGILTASSPMDASSSTSDTSSSTGADTTATTTATTTPTTTTMPPADMAMMPDPCEPIPGVSYTSLSISGPPSDRPPPEHGDLNIALRGWSETGGTLGLVDVGGPTDNVLPPQLDTVFGDDRVPVFTLNYRVNNWDWGCNCRSTPIDTVEVSLTGFQTAPGEVVEVPDSGYEIDAGGYEVLVLFVDDSSITLKYTREDNVVSGYAVHFDGICVEPSLRARYEADRAAGTTQLPGLRANEPVGRARGNELRVAIRDTGAFMDPRVRKDWWEW